MSTFGVVGGGWGGGGGGGGAEAAGGWGAEPFETIDVVPVEASKTATWTTPWRESKYFRTPWTGPPGPVCVTAEAPGGRLPAVDAAPPAAAGPPTSTAPTPMTKATAPRARVPAKARNRFGRAVISTSCLHWWR